MDVSQPKMSTTFTQAVYIRYSVVEKRSPLEQLRAFLAARPAEAAGIVYALSRKKVEEVAQRLREDRVTEADQHVLFQAIAPQVEDGLYLVPKVIE